MSVYIVFHSRKISSSKRVYVRTCNGTSQHGVKIANSMCGTVKKWHSSYRVILGIYCGDFFRPLHETRYMLDMYVHFFLQAALGGCVFLWSAQSGGLMLCKLGPSHLVAVLFCCDEKRRRDFSPILHFGDHWARFSNSSSDPTVSA